MMTKQIKVSSSLAKIQIRQVIIICAYLVISTLLCYFGYLLKDLNTAEWTYYMSIVILLHMSISLIAISLVGVDFLSLTVFFLALTYLFHFGHILLMGLFPNYEFQDFNIFSRVSFVVVQQATMFQLLTIVAVVLGVMLSNRLASKEKKSLLKQLDEESIILNKSTILSGWLIVLLCFPIRLISDWIKFKASMSGNYFDVFNTGESGISSMFGYFTFIGVALLIMEYGKYKKIKASSIMAITFCYLVVTMLSGNRGQQLTIILMLVYVYFKCVYNIKAKTFIFLAIAGWFLMIYLNTVFSIRLNGFPTIQELTAAYQNSMETNPMLKMVEELGSSQYTVCLVMEQVKNLEKAAFGTTYLAGFPLVFVNIGGILDKFVYTSHFAKALDTPFIGGSFIGELFFNFRYWGLIFAVFIGFGINKVSQKIERLILQKEFIRVAYYIPIFTYSLWWVRDAFFGWMRPTVWGGIFILCIHDFARKHIIRRVGRD